MRHLIFIITMHIRLDLVFVIQGLTIDVRAKEEGFVYVNGVVGKRDSSQIKDKDIKTMAMWMSRLVARHLFSFTLIKIKIG